MSYLCFDFKIQPREPWADVIASELGDAGFSMFEDTEQGILAYAAKEEFSQEVFDTLEWHQNDLVQVTYSVSEIEKQNWNQEWEKNFDPVEIGGFMRISAPFHEHKEGFEHQISIMPKMAFGTGHHATTYSVCQLMRALDFEGKKVLDMGCGTGVLGILAYKMGASIVVGIDIDDWATENCTENCQANDCHMEVITGDVSTLEKFENQYFEVVIANINRNILLQDMAAYARVLEAGGTLLLSGFYEKQDAPIILKACTDLGLKYVTHIENNLWTAHKYQKI